MSNFDESTLEMKTASPTQQDINTMKLHLVEQILAEQNTDMLQAFGDFMDKNRIVAHTVDGRPLTREAYIQEIDKGIKDVEEGRTFSSDEVKEKIASWGRK
jgi:predicted transcriptional regulator